MPVALVDLSCEHYPDPLGIHHTRPRFSWRFQGDARCWLQESYDLAIRYHDTSESETFHVESSESILVPWPGRDLQSRDRVHVKVRVCGRQSTGQDGETPPASATFTDWIETQIEVALLERSDWQGRLISGGAIESVNDPKRPVLLRKLFQLPDSNNSDEVPKSRLYITAHGCYKVYINGTRVGDHAMAPGWQSYNHRLHYQTYDISDFVKTQGDNTIGVVLGEGWYATRLNWGGGRRNVWGSDPGVLLQLERDGQIVVKTDSSSGWEWSYGPLVRSELYDGEEYDGTAEIADWSVESSPNHGFKLDVRETGFPKGTLIAAESPPVRTTEVLRPKEIITTPSGKTVLDFGQNMVGWLRFESHPGDAKRGDVIVLRHAEVMEKGEICTRTLRVCKAAISYTVGDSTARGYEPSFTFFGFRYVQVDGWNNLSLDDVSGQVLHTDMERTGWFECDHPMINKLWSNVNWGLRGNFLSVPTDCPQRDERLGWTGDLQVFAETASFLYNTTSMLSAWLEDLAHEQLKDSRGFIPFVVPNTLGPVLGSGAIWGDVAVVLPKDLWTASGDRDILTRQYESMTTWMDVAVNRADTGLWNQEWPQFGDWLDPKAPSDTPWDSRTDSILVADAWLINSTEHMAKVAAGLGKMDDAERYKADMTRIKTAWQEQYMTAKGRLMSDTQTAYALALHFDLLPENTVAIARQRLDTLVRKAVFQITTGFAGTPVILQALSENGLLQHAYRMFQEKEFPSIMYPVSLGATTIVRWDKE